MGGSVFTFYPPNELLQISKKIAQVEGLFIC